MKRMGLADGVKFLGVKRIGVFGLATSENGMAKGKERMKRMGFVDGVRIEIMKRIGVFGLAALVSFNAAAAVNNAEAKKVEDYLNSFKTLSADFVQIASNGEKVEGRLYIEKPNKIRMEYGAPSNILIVGNGDYIVYYDKELEQITNIDYEDIPAAAVLAGTVKIDGDKLKMTDYYQDPGMTRVKLQYKNTQDLGPFTLVFANNPFEIKQWKVVTPQAMEVSLSLYDTVVDGKLDGDLFKFRKSETKDRFRRK